MPINLFPSTPQPTQAERDRQELYASVRQSAQDLAQAASRAKQAHERFWAKSPERILAVLNHDVAYSLEVFAKTTATAEALNPLLAGFGPRFPVRVPAERGRLEIVFNAETNKFELVEPAPEP